MAVPSILQVKEGSELLCFQLVVLGEETRGKGRPGQVRQSVPMPLPADREGLPLSFAPCFSDLGRFGEPLLHQRHTTTSLDDKRDRRKRAANPFVPKRTPSLQAALAQRRWLPAVFISLYTAGFFHAALSESFCGSV